MRKKLGHGQLTLVIQRQLQQVKFMVTLKKASSAQKRLPLMTFLSMEERKGQRTQGSCALKVKNTLLKTAM